MLDFATCSVVYVACSWQLRICAMRTARRAYAKALHLAPGQGSFWGDVSATFYHEAQLRRAHPKLDPKHAHQLRALAESLIRGWLFSACSPLPLLSLNSGPACLLLHASQSDHLTTVLAVEACHKWHPTCLCPQHLCLCPLPAAPCAPVMILASALDSLA